MLFFTWRQKQSWLPKYSTTLNIRQWIKSKERKSLHSLMLHRSFIRLSHGLRTWHAIIKYVANKKTNTNSIRVFMVTQCINNIHHFNKGLFTVRTKNNSFINHHHSYEHLIIDDNFLLRQILVRSMGQRVCRNSFHACCNISKS